MDKSPDAFRTISEVAEDLDLPQHVLRFWETRFKQIKPMKRGGGRRYYRPDDVGLLRGIKGLLYDEGYTIRGVQRLLKEHGNKIAIDFGTSGSLNLSEPPQPGDLEGQGLVASRPALDVAEYEKSEVSDKKNGGFFSRIKSGANFSNISDDAVELEKGDVEVLKNTLQELLECKRLLDQTRQT
ncbi:MAG: MerR family transcriptional regulator [Pseudomonadota bacterium]